MPSPARAFGAALRGLRVGRRLAVLAGGGNAGVFGALRCWCGTAGRRIGGQHGGRACNTVEVRDDLGGGLAQRLKFLGALGVDRD